MLTEAARHEALRVATELCLARGVCTFSSPEAMIEFLDLAEATNGCIRAPLGGAAGVVERIRRGSDINAASAEDAEEGCHAPSDVSAAAAVAGDDSEASTWWLPYFVSSLTDAPLQDLNVPLPPPSQQQTSLVRTHPNKGPLSAAMPFSNGGGASAGDNAIAVVKAVTRLAVLPVALVTAAVFVTASTIVKHVGSAVERPVVWTAANSVRLSKWIRQGYRQKRGQGRGRGAACSKNNDDKNNRENNNNNTNANPSHACQRDSHNTGVPLALPSSSQLPMPLALMTDITNEFVSMFHKEERKEHGDEANAGPHRHSRGADESEGSSSATTTPSCSSDGSFSSSSSRSSFDEKDNESFHGAISNVALRIVNTLTLPPLSSASSPSPSSTGNDTHTATAPSRPRAFSSSLFSPSETEKEKARKKADHGQKRGIREKIAPSPAGFLRSVLFPGEGKQHEAKMLKAKSDSEAIGKTKAGSRSGYENEKQTNNDKRNATAKSSEVIFFPAMQFMSAKVLAYLSGGEGEGDSGKDGQYASQMAGNATNTTSNSRDATDTQHTREEEGRNVSSPRAAAEFDIDAEFERFSGGVEDSSDGERDGLSGSSPRLQTNQTDGAANNVEVGERDATTEAETLVVDASPPSPPQWCLPFNRVFTLDEWVDLLLRLNIRTSSGEAVTEHLILTQHLVPIEVTIDVPATGKGRRRRGEGKGKRHDGIGEEANEDNRVEKARGSHSAPCFGNNKPKKKESKTDSKEIQSHSKSAPHYSHRTFTALYFPLTPSLKEKCATLLPVVHTDTADGDTTTADGEATKKEAKEMAGTGEEEKQKGLDSGNSGDAHALDIQGAARIALWKYTFEVLATQVTFWEASLEQCNASLAGVVEEMSEVRGQLRETQNELPFTAGDHSPPSSSLSSSPLPIFKFLDKVTGGNSKKNNPEHEAEARRLALIQSNITRLQQRQQALMLDENRLHDEICALKRHIGDNKLVAIECEKLKTRLSSVSTPHHPSPFSMQETVSTIENLMSNFGDGPWPKI